MNLPATERSSLPVAQPVRAAGRLLGIALALGYLSAAAAVPEPVYFNVVPGAHPHDVAAAPTPKGLVYYTAQSTGRLGILDPATGKVEEVALGDKSSPHGVVVGPDGAPWITDGGLNAIVRFDPETEKFASYPSNRANATVRQMLGRAGEAWGAESGTDRLVMVPSR